MSGFTITQHIKSTPEKAFVALCDFTHAPEFHQHVVESHFLTNGPLRVGTRISETHQVLGWKEIDEMTIIKFNPPHSMVLEEFTHGTLYRFGFEVAETHGGCKVKHVFTHTPKTLMAKITAMLFFFMNASMKKLHQQDLAEAKAYAEAL